MRRVIAFPCAEETLIGTIDEAGGTTGLLIVSGGNEIRSGAHRGTALLAAALAARGVPVFRYDRRGIGDSAGGNGGWESAAPDLAAAVAAFRAEAPWVTRIVGFGNCDAATTLALFGRDAGIDAVVLANPWLAGETDDLPPAAAIRARYAARLRDPLSLLRGANIRSFSRGLWKLVRVRPQQPLARRVIASIDDWGHDASIVLASGDATAIAFRDAAREVPVTTVATDSHSFAGARTALEAFILSSLPA